MSVPTERSQFAPRAETLVKVRTDFCGSTVDHARRRVRALRVSPEARNHSPQDPSGTVAAHLEELADLKIDSVYGASPTRRKSPRPPRPSPSSRPIRSNAFGYRTVADILRSVRGFYVTHDRNYSFLGVRGFSRPGDYNSRVLLLIDGHRLNDNIFGGASSAPSFRWTSISLSASRSSAVRARPSMAPARSLPSSTSSPGGRCLKGWMPRPRRAASTVRKARSAMASRFGSGADWSCPARRTRAMDSERCSSRNSTIPRRTMALPKRRRRPVQGSIRKVDVSAVLRFRACMGRGRRRFRPPHSVPYSTIRAHERSKSRVISICRYRRRLRGRLGARFAAVLRPIWLRWRLRLSMALKSTAARRQQGFRSRQLVGHGAEGQQAVGAGTARRWCGYRDNIRQDQFNYDQEPFVQYLDDRRSSTNWALYAQDEITLHEELILNVGLRHDHYDSFGGTTNPKLALIYDP